MAENFQLLITGQAGIIQDNYLRLFPQNCDEIQPRRKERQVDLSCMLKHPQITNKLRGSSFFRPGEQAGQAARLAFFPAMRDASNDLCFSMAIDMLGKAKMRMVSRIVSDSV